MTIFYKGDRVKVVKAPFDPAIIGMNGTCTDEYDANNLPPYRRDEPVNRIWVHLDQKPDKYGQERWFFFEELESLDSVAGYFQSLCSIE